MTLPVSCASTTTGGIRMNESRAMLLAIVTLCFLGDFVSSIAVAYSHNTTATDAAYNDNTTATDAAYNDNTSRIATDAAYSDNTTTTAAYNDSTSRTATDAAYNDSTSRTATDAAYSDNTTTTDAAYNDNTSRTATDAPYNDNTTRTAITTDNTTGTAYNDNITRTAITTNNTTSTALNGNTTRTAVTTDNTTGTAYNDNTTRTATVNNTIDTAYAHNTTRTATATSTTDNAYNDNTTSTVTTTNKTADATYTDNTTRTATATTDMHYANNITSYIHHHNDTINGNTINVPTIGTRDNIKHISSNDHFQEMTSVCPGAAQHLTDHPQFAIFRVNVSDCKNPARDERARQGVVYGVCKDSTAFCEYLVQVPHGMVVRARVTSFTPHCGHRAYSIFGDGWAPNRHPTIVTVSCKTPGMTKFAAHMSTHNSMHVFHYNRPILHMEFQAVRHILQTVNTSQYGGYVVSVLNKGFLLIRTEICTSVKVPQGHIIMISSEKLANIFECSGDVKLLWKERNGTKTSVVRVSGIRKSAEAYYTDRLRICFGLVGKLIETSCYKLLFSFHPESQVPQRLSSGLYNCSVDHYLSFRQHLDCNMKVECEDGRDETAHCPFLSPACNGMVAARTKCYKVIEFDKFVIFSRARDECRAHDMRLASIKSAEELEAFKHLDRNWDITPLLGLVCGWSSRPFMYSQCCMWSDDTMVYSMDTLSSDNDIEKTRVIRHFRYIYRHRVRIQSSVQVLSVACEKQHSTVDFAAAQSVVFSVVQDLASVFTHTTQELVSCPHGHVTHVFLACYPESHCQQFTCVFLNETNVFEELRVTQNGSHEVTMFSCSNEAAVISYTLVCDFRHDCQDQSDESFCKHAPCDAFSCNNGQCVSLDKRCNHHTDCVDDSDETGCSHGRGESIYNNQEEPPFLVNFDGTGYFTRRKMNVTESCPDTHYRCRTETGNCLPVYTRCNGFYDCPHREDETDCEEMTCPGFYRCRASTVCVHADHLCDGWPQCPQRDDEWLCDMTCPAGCLCQGHAFLCPQPFSAHLFPQLRFLDAKGSGMMPSDLTLNTYIVHLSLAQCSLRSLSDMNFPNLQILDLSYNKMTNVAVNAFLSASNLQTLILKGNPLTSLSSKPTNLRHNALTRLDLSRTFLGVLDGHVLCHMPNIQYMNVSFSPLQSIESGGFQSLPHLKVLDLRGSIVRQLPTDLFLGLNDLETIFSSDSRLCCQYVLPDVNGITCMAPQNYMSSCDNMLFEMYRVSFWTVGVLTIAGNIACFLGYCVVMKITFQVSSVAFMANLQTANICMGIYASIIATAHETFRGQYLLHEHQWTDSVTCKVAGFLSLLSSEVSVLIIWLLTLDHFIVQRFPSSTYRFSRTSAAVTCGMAWLLGLLVASIPLLPGHRQRYGQTAICTLMLHDMRRFNHDFRFFHVVLTFNFLLYLMVSCAQITLYRGRVMHQARLNSNHALIDLLRKVAMTDAVGWFSVTTTSVMALAGVAGSDKVNVDMAVFMLPLNSALNPLLCLWDTVAYMRRQKREERLLRVLKTRVARAFRK